MRAVHPPTLSAPPGLTLPADCVGLFAPPSICEPCACASTSFRDRTLMMPPPARLCLASTWRGWVSAVTRLRTRRGAVSLCFFFVLCGATLIECLLCAIVALVVACGNGVWERRKSIAHAISRLPLRQVPWRAVALRVLHCEVSRDVRAHVSTRCCCWGRRC